MGAESAEPIIVEFDPDDGLNPKNWSRSKRWFMTYIAGLLAFNAGFASSAPVGIVSNILAYFHCSQEVAALTISLFIFGYCVGPLLWGPLSEQYGRRPIFLVAFPIYTAFQVGCALSHNAASLNIFRLLTGIFAAAPLTNSGALISDIWDARTRGKALAVFTVAPFIGPSFGPVVGGWISQSGTSWRWLFWVLTIFSGACIPAILLFLPETYAPIILANKAQLLRKKLGQRKTFRDWVDGTILKPCIMLVQEPMLIATTVYISFVYGCMYLIFEAYPVVFTQEHHLDAGVSGMVYIPIAVPPMSYTHVHATPVLQYYFIFHPRYERAAAACAPSPVPPELRLESAKWGAPLFAIGFFWFGWTSYPSIPFWAPLFASVLLGTATIWIFRPSANALCADVYLFAAASALATNTVVRSAASAGFPVRPEPRASVFSPLMVSPVALRTPDV
ncbi:hypothetical protein IEO21_07887 [Rhodonia placenta]|uniref:Major facilitator superfamily (MFS) profile domain-containing protein n=1 Tax=Rhodonia placenta TaxID=104341 RepID=A0A8H7NXN7_9APHY|nr:hypothetical protein IEO21_07887 [Postia placenta]